ncbi:MAG: hypothetical protein Gaeavirus22_7 [Gaeavirus sp.]|uniref:Uncharacterized protein n=1 Tax=Gaeavirus sp. TaxID=2487767 RepID=A0A3G5A462_9VIRU|nr:MAG: hypothetical protein Gaeavirus22_7 [Gaeavirus sp.]
MTTSLFISGFMLGLLVGNIVPQIAKNNIIDDVTAIGILTGFYFLFFTTFSFAFGDEMVYDTAIAIGIITGFYFLFFAMFSSKASGL